MILIEVQPLSAVFTEGPPPDSDQAVGSRAGQESQSTDDPSGQPTDGLSSFPRVPSRFPGSFQDFNPFVLCPVGEPATAMSGLLLPAEPQEL